MLTHGFIRFAGFVRSVELVQGSGTSVGIELGCTYCQIDSVNILPQMLTKLVKQMLLQRLY